MFISSDYEWIRKERNFLLSAILFLVVLFTVAMIQNYIRYGISDSYRPWRSVSYLSVSLVLFIALIPGILRLAQRAIDRFPGYYLWSATAITLGAVSIFYFISGMLMYAFGFFEWPVDIRYARQYFGREALFHVILVIGVCLYAYISDKKRPGKLVKGSVGRKSVILSADQIYWIAADDHYLKLYTAEAQLIKRSTLDQMTKALHPEFIRIHRKYLVNKKHIIGKERVGRDEYILVRGGSRLKVGRSFQPFDVAPFLTKETTL